MSPDQLFEQIRLKHSFLCVGLDTDLNKIPEFLLSKDDPLFEFNKAIVDATHDLAIAFKPNLAFYEVHGPTGLASLMKTVKYIKRKYPEMLVIADAKRGDIGSTARMYARAYFKSMNCDGVTVSPYLGKDSVDPYLDYPDKWTILLAITSNAGYADFQLIRNADTGQSLFEEVVQRSMHWGSDGNMMYVVGATHPQYFQAVRRLVPDHFLLVPGVGEQGGSLEKVAQLGLNRRCGLIVNSSRGIIYADITGNFAQASRQRALKLQQQMEQILEEAKLL